MILFHVPRIDSGDLRLWQRTILPACLLRRAGVPARVVSGRLSNASLSGASAIVLGGSFDGGTVELSRQARAAGLRVILDIADTRSPVMDAESIAAAAAFADVVVAGNPELAAMCPQPIGDLCVIADVPFDQSSLLDVATMFPGIASKVFAGAVTTRTIDAVRRLRHWLQAESKGRKARGIRIVWFGDGTGLNQEAGLGELLLAAGDLVDLNQDVPFELRVIGTSRRLFRRLIGRWPIQAEFRRLTIPALAHDLRGADLCFLPGGGDAASRARSTARAEIARDLGIPVLTVPGHGLVASPRMTLASDWSSALRMIVAGKKARVEMVARRDPGTIRAAWHSAATLVEHTEPPTLSNDVPPAAPHRLHVLFLLQQFQDLDLICPVAEAAMADMQVSVAILTKIAVPATRRLERLRAQGARIVFWRARNLDAGKIPITRGCFNAAVTASDGPGPGARHAAAFVRAANAAGIPTFNLQHGLDNSGLTFGPPPQSGTQFNARFVLTWGGFERLSAAADAVTRAKVIPTGCPKSRMRAEDAADFPLAGRRFIAVFENLHWWRYSNAYRNRFVEDLIEAARAMPDLIFVLKPHMGGRWFTRTNAERPLPDNLIVADPGLLQWRRFSADSFLAHAAGIITTPSTIALDAARYELPTALVGYGITAENYAPLFRIDAAADWRVFLEQVRTGGYDMSKARQFRDAAMVPGDAVARTLQAIRLAASGRSQGEIVAVLHPDIRAVPA